MMISRFGHHYPKKSFAIWRDQIVRELHELFPKAKAIDVDCVITIQYWNGDKRRRDLPAMIDSIFHIMEKAELIIDDSLVKKLHWLPQGYSKQNPKGTIFLETM